MDTTHIIPGQRENYPQHGRDTSNGLVPGMQIVEGDRVINNPPNQWEKGNEAGDFDASKKRVTSWDASNFQGAYNAAPDAAAKNLPGGGSVFFGVVDKDMPGSQAFMKNLEQMKAKYPGMQIVLFDKAEIANDPKLAGIKDWVAKNAGDSNMPFGAQFAVRPGKDGKPEGGQFINNHWGPDVSSMDDQIKYGKMFTDKFAGQFKIPETKPEEKPKADAKVDGPPPEVPKRELDVENQYREIQDKLQKAKQAKSFEEARKLLSGKPSKDGKDLGGAIALADSIDQKAVSAQMTQNATDVAAAKKALAETKEGTTERTAAEQKLNALQDTERQLQTLRDAPAQTRAEYAKRLVAEGGTLAASEAKEGETKEQAEARLKAVASGKELLAQGYAMINEAATKVPGYFKSDAGKSELRSMGYGDKAIENINSIGQYGPQPPNPNLLSENFYGMSEEERNAFYKHGEETAEQTKAREEKIAERQREILESAIKEAKEKGLPLVLKFGMEGCPPCEKMEKEVMQPLAAALDGKAVVASVDGPGAEAVLREHGMSVDANGMTYPTIGVINVNSSGNLNAVAGFKGESVGTLAAATATLSQAAEKARAERLQGETFAAHEAKATAEAQKLERERIRNEQKKRQQPAVDLGFPYVDVAPMFGLV